MSTIVSGTLVDARGQLWTNAPIQFTFQPNPNKPGPYIWSGGAYNPMPSIIYTDAAGHFSITLPANNEFVPFGTFWKVTIGPGANLPAVVLTLSLITGSLDIGTLFTSKVTNELTRSLWVPRAYNDAEVQVPPNSGQLYYDVTSKALKYYENGIWNPLSSGGGGGMVWPAAGVAVSSGSSSWSASIDPTTLATKSYVDTKAIPYPAAGIGVSTGTAWGTSINPASIAYLDVTNAFTKGQQIAGTVTAMTAASGNAPTTSCANFSWDSGTAYIDSYGAGSPVGVFKIRLSGAGQVGIKDVLVCNQDGSVTSKIFRVVDPSGGFGQEDYVPALGRTRFISRSNLTSPGQFEFSGLDNTDSVFKTYLAIDNTTGAQFGVDVRTTGILYAGGTPSNSLALIFGAGYTTYFDARSNSSGARGNLQFRQLDKDGAMSIDTLTFDGNGGATFASSITCPDMGSTTAATLTLGASGTNAADASTTPKIRTRTYLPGISGSVWPGRWEVRTQNLGPYLSAGDIAGLVYIFNATTDNASQSRDAMTLHGSGFVRFSGGVQTLGPNWDPGVSAGNFSYNALNTYIDSVGDGSNMGKTVLRVMRLGGAGLINQLEVNSGGIYVSGTIGAGGAKAFVIPHPLDKTKDLWHASLEGPECGVYYRGEAITKDGRVVIALPDYFEALTSWKGRTIQLTKLIDDDEELIIGGSLVAGRIKDGKFLVRALSPEVKFYWEVKAIRKDIEPLRTVQEKRVAPPASL